MRLYTKTGDSGQTGLIGGDRVSKDHARVEAYGQVDELNAVLGWAVAACVEDEMRSRLTVSQNQLFALGSQLADPTASADTPAVTPGDIAVMETWIDQATDAVAPLKNFILPGGSECACRLHIARTVCRRAERSAVTLARSEHIATESVTYLNRLADLLFAWSRLANAQSDVADVVWNTGKNPKPDGES